MRVVDEGSAAVSTAGVFISETLGCLSSQTVLRQNGTGDTGLKAQRCELWQFGCSLTTSSGTQGWSREEVDRRKHTS